ncbi:MAG: hypothetical protein PSN34_06255 [Urechidicola sp.]|nr:hypothetical protein [Urechidicola sp.]
MRTDFLLEDNDIKIENGDFAIGQSDQQNVEQIFIASPGEFKEFPLVGFAAVKYLKGVANKSAFKRNLKVQLQNDGYSPNIDLSKGYEQINIEV